MVDKEAVPLAEYFSDTVIILKAEFETVFEATFPYSDDKFLNLAFFAFDETTSGDLDVFRIGVNGDGEAISTATSGAFASEFVMDKVCDETCVPGLDLFAFDSATEPTTTSWTVAKAVLNWDAVEAEGSNYDQLDRKYTEHLRLDARN